MKKWQFVQDWVARDPIKWQTLNADLISSRAGVTVEHYLVTAIGASIGIGILFAVVGFVISGLVIAMQKASGTSMTTPVIGFHLPASIGPIPMGIIEQVGVGILAFSIAAAITYFIALQWPGIQKGTRSTKINLTLHNAVAYMYAMRKGGGEMMVIFRSISDHSNIYGEVALEFRQIVRDADFFGLDEVSAIRRLNLTTPSTKLKDFLQDLLSVIESGGDMATFLSTRVHLFQEEARFEQKQFLGFLSLVAESYVTLFVAGPLFLIIIMVVMGMMGGSAVLQLSMVTYVMLPVGTSLFMVMIDLVSIKSEVVSRFTKKKLLHEYSDVRVRSTAGEEPFFATLARYDKWRQVKTFLSNPLQAFVTKPSRILFISVPIGIIYALVHLLMVHGAADLETYVDLIDDHIIVAILLILVPYAVFFEGWNRKLGGIESSIPEFLDRMAGINQVGLTMAQAITIMVNANLGVLGYEIKRIKRDMEWGANFSEALMRFERRITTPIIARMVVLITKASEMSGQINEVLNIAASDARMSDVLKKERLGEMFIYTAIVYLSFMVFIFVVGVLSSQFLPVLGGIQPGSVSQAGGAFSGLGSIPIKTFDRLLYHACVLQGFFSGLIAGQMGESSIGSGVKHACIMVIIALIAFNTVV